jgi:hypothetical protein
VIQVTDQQVTAFRDQGYLVVPGVLDAGQIAQGREIVAALLEREPIPDGPVGSGAEALTRIDEMNPGPYPDVELGTPVQVTGPAGSVLFAHYLLGHNIGGHVAPNGAQRRETIYYRLRAHGHVDRWRRAVTDPLLEFRPQAS